MRTVCPNPWPSSCSRTASRPRKTSSRPLSRSAWRRTNTPASSSSWPSCPRLPPERSSAFGCAKSSCPSRRSRLSQRYDKTCPSPPPPPAAGATRMMHTRRQFMHRTGCAAALGALSALTVRAEAIGPVKILYGFSAGSAGDTVARRVGDKLAGSAYTSHAAVVENKPGASGRIALELLKAAPGDGSVLALAPFSCTAIYPHIYRQLTYDPANDFQPVSIAAIMHHALAVGPLVPASV